MKLFKTALSNWGSTPAFPTATSTGSNLPGGLVNVGTGYLTSGTGWTWNSGAQAAYITSPNTTFTGYNVIGGVSAYANDITIENCSISGGVYANSAGLLLQNCTVTNTGASSIGVNLDSTSTYSTIKNCTIAGQDASANRVNYCVYCNTSDPDMLISGCNMYWMRVGVSTSNSGGYTIINNYMANFGFQTGDHVDGVYIQSNSTGLVSGNTILNQLNQTDAIIIQNLFGVTGNVTIQGNLLAGGTYAFYGGAATGGSYPFATNVNFSGNYFTTQFYANGGNFAAAADWSTVGNSWYNNYWLDGPSAGTLVAHP